MRDIFAVSTEGGIYPCHMNVGEEMQSVSSIWDSGEELKRVASVEQAFQLKNNIECFQCWANRLCGGCSRHSFYNSEKKSYQEIPLKNVCDEFRYIVGLSLLKICEVRNNPSLWKELLNRINKKEICHEAY